MEVILLQDVEKVGLRGEVVSVARGYMRNYLAPRKLAQEATPARVAELRKRDEQRSRHQAQSFEQAQDLAETLRKTVLRFEVNAGPRGTLFGSVTPTDIVDELWRTRKIRVDRRKIDLPDPIKRVGRYEVPIELFTDVKIDVKTLVVPIGGELPEEDEAPTAQAETEQTVGQTEPVSEGPTPPSDGARSAAGAEEAVEAELAPPAVEETPVDAALETGLVDPEAKPS